MTVSTNSDYSTIQITSSNLTSFAAISSVVLYGTIGCDGDYSDTIIEADVTLATGTFTVDLSELFGTTSLDDNIYGFKLVITKTDDSIITEYNCLFVDNETTCAIADKVVSSGSTDLALYGYLLKYGQDCDCDCSDLCIIFKKLQNELSDCTSC